MIAALVDPSRSAQDKPVFRGRDVTYWLAHFYPFCAFAGFPSGKSDFEFLFVFSEDIFPVASAAAGRELRHWLQKQNSAEPWLVAPENMPFFIASRAFVEKEKISLRAGVFRQTPGREKSPPPGPEA